MGAEPFFSNRVLNLSLIFYNCHHFEPVDIFMSTLPACMFDDTTCILMFFTLVYFQVLNFIYDILFKLLTIFIWLYRFVYIVQPCDNMSHTVAFCITIYSDCWGCSMLTLVWVSKQFENVLRICSITVAYCNKCDIVTMTVNNLSSLCHHLFPRKRPG